MLETAEPTRGEGSRTPIFKTDDERIIAVRGQFAVFTEFESADLSVLGRDVTNMKSEVRGRRSEVGGQNEGSVSDL